MFQTNFLSTTKFEGHWTRMPPVSADLGRTVARKSSIGASCLCRGGKTFRKLIFNSQHAQHLQIEQINIFPKIAIIGSYFPNKNYLNELNKRNLIIVNRKSLSFSW